MPKVLRVSHVWLPMPKGEEAKARVFYGQTLGLREVMKPAALAARGGVWFDAGGFQLQLAPEEGEKPAGPRPTLAMEVDDVEAVRKDVTRRQLNVQDAPPIPGLRRFHAHDPFGNRLEFYQRG